jgi:hypothetical protein
LVAVTTTRPDMKYDKEKYQEGNQSWETVEVFGWRKKGEIVQIHIGRVKGAARHKNYSQWLGEL